MTDHTVRVSLDDGWLSLEVVCPYPAEQQDRVCWPCGGWTDEAGPSPLPGPQGCNYREWVDALAPDELLHGEWSAVVGLEVDWVGDSPQFRLEDPTQRVVRALLEHAEVMTSYFEQERCALGSDREWPQSELVEARALVAQWDAACAAPSLEERTPPVMCEATLDAARVPTVGRCSLSAGHTGEHVDYGYDRGWVLRWVDER